MLKKIIILITILLIFTSTTGLAATDLTVDISVDYVTNIVTISGELTGSGDWVTLYMESPTSKLEFIGNVNILGNNKYSTSFQLASPTEGDIYTLAIKADGMTDPKYVSFEYTIPEIVNIEVETTIDYITNIVTIFGTAADSSSYVTCHVEGQSKKLEYIGSAEVLDYAFEIRFGIENPILNGIYTGKIKAENATSGIDFQFEYVSPDIYGNTFETAYLIETNQTIQGKINYDGDIDVFKFIVDTDGTYYFDLSANLSTGISVYSETDLLNAVASGITTDGTLKLGVELLPDVTYYAFISSDNLSEYSLKVSSNAVIYVYDAGNRLISISFGGKILSFNYDDNGNLVSRTFVNE